MNNTRIRAIRSKWLKSNLTYQMVGFNNFDYSILNNCIYTKRRGHGSNASVNEAWIMFDTETSKKLHQSDPEHENHNHVVAWTISIRFLGFNIVTLYGHKPTELVTTLMMIHKAMPGDETIFYCHNLPYDYFFLRQFLYKALDYPVQQLNIKSHYPLYITFKCGIILKDSLMLAQRKLERWAADLGVTAKKVGNWKYDKIRSQSDIFSLRERSYIECDTLAGVECLDKTANILHKTVSTMPYTATGIVRNDLKNIGKQHRAHDRLKKQAPTFEQYIKLTMVFHGGYTHGNRYFIDSTIWDNSITCYDFASSYPFCLLAFKYPMEKFTNIGVVDADYIIQRKDQYAFMFRLTMTGVKLKDPHNPMPILQYSKCTDTVNAVVDNGRILYSDLISIYTTEVTLSLILQHYDYLQLQISECECAMKDYLPRWYTDYIYEKFKEKTELKDSDPVLYSIAKARLNSIYGCSCMKVKETIKEDYITGEYFVADQKLSEEYEKHINKRGTILNYAWGVWCTEYATINLHKLSGCLNGEWLYSDTDSIYGTDWDIKKLEAFNEECKDLLRKNNYGAVKHNGKDYWLGIAEFDGSYKAMRICGAKRYCCLNNNNSIKLTVAGVPKKTGAGVLRSIDDFTDGLVFPGKKTGKLTHTYYHTDKIYIDDQGNETGDSIDLTPCDYLLSTIDIFNIDDLFTEEISIQVYE